MRYWMLLWAMIAALLGVAACSTVGENAPQSALPLAEDKPTFVFFYTDG